MSVTIAELVAYIRGDDTQLEADLAGAEKKSESAGANMAKVLGGAIVGGAAIAGAAIIGIGTEVFNVASDIDAATDQISASLGYTGDDLKLFGDTIKSVYANNFGDSIEDVGKAIEETAKTLKLTAEDGSLQRMTENAFRLRDVFGVDVHESLDAVKTLMDQFGVSGDQAFDLIADGYQRGLDRSGDFLDTIGEYSVQFANGGASASQFFKFIETGAQGGVLGTDKAADAFKEFGIRIKDGSDLSKHSLGELGISFADLEAGFTDGSVTAVSAMQDILYKIFQIDDPITRARIGVGLFGTQWEDLGESGIKALSEIEEGFGVHEGAITSLDSKYTNLGSVVEGMWRQFQVGIAPAGEAILGFVNENLPAFQGAVNTVSGVVVTAIGYIPLAITAMRVGWDEDWGKMRTTLNSFTSEVPGQLNIFWTEVQDIFKTGGDGVEVDWDMLWGYNLGQALTGALTLFIAEATEFTRAINGIFSAFYALFHGDWAGFWAGLEQTANAATDDMLNAMEYVFGVEFRNAIVTGLTYAWDGMKDMWKQISEWFASTFGTLSSWIMPHIETPTGGGGGGGFGSNPIQGAIDAINGSQGFGQAVGQSSVGNITLNQHFHGQADARTVKDATSDGVLNASRRLGLR